MKWPLWLKRVYYKSPQRDRRWHVIPMRSMVTKLVPTKAQMPIHNQVAINIADDVIYRNVNGQIIKYVREK